MKKIIAIAAALVAFATVASAQPRAIGVRATYGAEISYQHSMGSNFVEADLGLAAGNGFYLTGVYDFVFASVSNFNFYAGPGAQVGFYNYEKDGKTAGGINLGVVGQLGAEYMFSQIPLQLSLDWRPCFGLLHGGFGYEGFALGIRYAF